jgi:CSLREA domain-containing protein
MTIPRFYLYVPLLASAACFIALATTYTVTSTGDGSDTCMPSPGACTLRAAVQPANATAGANTIVDPAGAYLLSQSPLCATRTSGDPTIRRAARIALCITVGFVPAA